ncbi:hypothetical protein F5972_08355 [Microbispora cellulosiformans]|uniref:Uncharacterized protein n=1 Tax=Microbispora cellulosiformans TaxID=2614688 RepID=A0A5J5K7I8_9ACTN|nr:hypothetical protein [Microbispora cellulosiformans]KAA9379654.1 hypothetical protein F5972_08355 [Microbispora cellulosiformans]
MMEAARELSKILKPDPEAIEGRAPKEREEELKAVRKQREALAGELVAAAQSSPTEDPVLARLQELARKKREIKNEIRLLLTYAREFTRPEPYRLKALAEAADMSISSVRTECDKGDKAYIADQIGRSDLKKTVMPTTALEYLATFPSPSTAPSLERRQYEPGMGFIQTD